MEITLETVYDQLAIYPEKCNNCLDCERACAKVKTGREDGDRSRIRTIKNLKEAYYGPVVCLQCNDPDCMHICPAGAIHKDPETGIVSIDDERCVRCLLCTLACPYCGVFYSAKEKKMIKCDLCAGDPECVKVCKPGALQYLRHAEIYKEWASQEDLFSPGLSACMGCNSELIIRFSLRILGKNTVLATPPGCIPGFGAVGYSDTAGAKVPIFHPLLSNTAAMLSGIKRYYQRIGRDVQVVAFAGDGGTADVGFQALSGAVERGENIIYICVDNEGYMNTGIQRSGTTPFGAWTTTTPVGKRSLGKKRESKNLPMIMVMHGAPYVATASTAFLEDYAEKLKKAMKVRDGVAYIHLFSPCPTGWRFQPNKTIEVSRLAVETNFFPLWEYERGRFRFTRSVENPKPIEEYLRLVGKYSHLTREQITEIERIAKERCEMLKSFQPVSKS
ncbi:MAG: thiamine pyrophosphate-dependent enzyme [Thermodesulfobacteriota bacterium]